MMDEELRFSVVSKFHGHQDKMDEGDKVEEMKELHKPQKTLQLPPRRVLCLI